MFDSLTPVMKALLETRDHLTSEDLERVFDDQAASAVIELRSVIDTLEAEWLRRVDDLNGRTVVTDEGHTSLASWLADHCRVAWGRARRAVTVAGALREMPLTRSAFRAGVIDPASVQVLVDAHSRHPADFVDHEEGLVNAAAVLPLRGLRQAVAYWCQAIDYQAAIEDEKRLNELRRLHASRTWSGMIRTDADLDPESGDTFLTALGAAEGPPHPADTRTAPQRRADALVDICRFYLDHADVPHHGGQRPHLRVTVDLGALEGRAGHRAELDHAGVITPDAARRLACDAAVTRIISNGRSQILDIGRATRTIPTAIRTALDNRDQGCTWDGCDRPPHFCDAHHITHWADGGPTALDNLRLLCRRHHRLMHDGEWRPP